MLQRLPGPLLTASIRMQTYALQASIANCLPSTFAPFFGFLDDSFHVNPQAGNGFLGASAKIWTVLPRNEIQFQASYDRVTNKPNRYEKIKHLIKRAAACEGDHFILASQEQKTELGGFSYGKLSDSEVFFFLFPIETATCWRWTSWPATWYYQKNFRN